jgi:regulator of sigma E protease
VSGSPGFFYTILWFLVAIGPLIFIHELGHFLAARWCGVQVEAFSIGFGREIAGWTDRHGTRWKIGWMPMGGYVRFAGDWDAASQADGAWRELPEDERVRTFHAKPVWQRALIVVAGPVANFLAAVMIFMGLFASTGIQVTPPVISAVAADSAAAAAGFKAGDRIVAMDGREIDDFSDISDHVRLRAKQAITFGIVRNDVKTDIVATPRSEVFVSRFGTKAEFGLLGIGSVRAETVFPPWYRLPVEGVKATAAMVRSMVDGLGRIIMGYISVKELGGPVMMARMSGEIATMGWEPFILFVAAISINLGFINLLPVPVLDGGHLLFCGIEALQRRPVSNRTQEWAYGAGFALVVGFMLMVTFNDFIRFGWFSRFGDLIG